MKRPSAQAGVMKRPSASRVEIASRQTNDKRKMKYRQALMRSIQCMTRPKSWPEWESLDWWSRKEAINGWLLHCELENFDILV